MPAAVGQAEIAELLARRPEFPGRDVARLVIVPGKIVNVVLRQVPPGAGTPAAGLAFSHGRT